MYPNMLMEIGFNKYYRVCVLILFIINVVHFIITFFKNKSDNCENRTVKIVAVLLLVATGFCIYLVNSGNKVGYHSGIKSQSPCEKEYKKYCLNGCDCYHLVDEDNVACNCTCLYGGKRCEKYMLWT